VEDALRGGFGGAAAEGSPGPGAESSPRARSRPWLVLTAGPMGAGKSHTVRWLAAAGAFPLASFVRVNPDAIKSRLPEHSALVAGGGASRAAAGSLLHRESGYIAELIERAAIARSYSVLVDGSLRNAAWYGEAIARLRATSPAYRVALLLVTATRATVLRRAQRRVAVTGREVPPEVIDDSLRRAPAAFAQLAPLADYAATIANDEDSVAPRFVAPASLQEFVALWEG